MNESLQTAKTFRQIVEQHLKKTFLNFSASFASRLLVLLVLESFAGTQNSASAIFKIFHTGFGFDFSLRLSDNYDIV